MSFRDELKRAQVTSTPTSTEVDEFDLEFEDDGFEGVGGGSSLGASVITGGVSTTATTPTVTGALGAGLGSSKGSAGSNGGTGVSGAHNGAQGLQGVGLGDLDGSLGNQDGGTETNTTTQHEGTAEPVEYDITISTAQERIYDTTVEAGEDEIVFDDDALDALDFAVESPETQASKAADSIMTVLLHEGEEFQQARKHLYNALPPSVFSDEHYMLYRLFYENRDRNFALTPQFIEVYYTHHLGDIENASKKIDIQAYGKVDDSYAKGYIVGILKKYEELKALEPSLNEKFFRDIENYRIYRKYSLAQDTLSTAYEILENGYRQKGSRKVLAGFDDMSNHIKREITSISSLFDDNDGTGYISLSDAIFNPPEESKVVKVGDFGQIQELNDAIGGLYSGQLVTIAGPSKAGKTKFCTRLIYDMLRKGQNVSVFPVEGGIQMFQAQIRAIHFHEYYKDNSDGLSDFNFPVTQQIIYQDAWDDIETNTNISLRELEQVSARDLVENTAYGSLDLIDMNLHLDTFIDVIDGSVSSNNSVAFMVDYMQLLNHPTSMSRQQALEKAYPELLRYCKKKNVLGISPAQYTQGAVKEMGKGTVEDTRTMIGSSYEIYKSSDLVLAMSGTVEELQDGIVTFESVPARLSKSFDRFQIYADLGSCQFISINNEEGSLADAL